jgi:hypothetical protein
MMLDASIVARYWKGGALGWSCLSFNFDIEKTDGMMPYYRLRNAFKAYEFMILYAHQVHQNTHNFLNL